MSELKRLIKGVQCGVIGADDAVIALYENVCNENAKFARDNDVLSRRLEVFKEYQVICGGLEKENADLRAKLGHTEESIKGRDLLIRTYQEIVANYESYKSEFDKTNEELKMKIEQLEAQVANLQIELDANKFDNDDFKDNLKAHDALLKMYDKSNRRVAELESQVAVLRGALEECQNVISKENSGYEYAGRIPPYEALMDKISEALQATPLAKEEQTKFAELGKLVVKGLMEFPPSCKGVYKSIFCSEYDNEHEQHCVLQYFCIKQAGGQTNG